MKSNDDPVVLGRLIKSKLDAFFCSFGEADHEERKKEVADLLWDNKVGIAHYLGGYPDSSSPPASKEKA